MCWRLAPVETCAEVAHTVLVTPGQFARVGAAGVAEAIRPGSAVEALGRPSTQLRLVAASGEEVGARDSQTPLVL